MALIFPDGSYTTNIYPTGGGPNRKPVAGRPGRLGLGAGGNAGGGYRVSADGIPVAGRPVLGGPNRKPVAGRPVVGGAKKPATASTPVDRRPGKAFGKGLKPAERAEKFSKRAENLRKRSEKLGERSKTETGEKATGLSNRSQKLGERATKYAKRAEKIKTNIAKRSEERKTMPGKKRATKGGPRRPGISGRSGKI